ncbi:MAG TPA: hypothetical protein VM093_00640 [Aeromicrobium sp.]|nr:hypothetical protein [Aeromicrobium sp.]
MTALRAAVSVVLASVVTGIGSPAFADSPSTWNSGPSRTLLENIIFFGGSVGGLFILITLFALLTARNNFVPEPPETGSEVAPSDHH